MIDLVAKATTERRSRRNISTSRGLLAVIAFAWACGSNGPSSPSEPTPDAQRELRVITTLYPLEYFAGRIGGDSAEVVSLMPAGVGAHDFEPTPADIRTLDSGDVVVYNGSGLEPWVDRAMEAVGVEGRTVVEASGGLAKRFADQQDGHAGGDQGELDPHVWLDPLSAVAQVKLIRDGLIRTSPVEATSYEANAASLITELEELHSRYQSALEDCRLHHLVVSHRAFGYLAARYDLEQVSIHGLSPEAEPSPRELADLSDKIADLGVEYLLVEPIASTRLAKTLADETGATLLTLHPVASLTPEELDRGETYFTLMDANLANLRTALECG